MEKTKQILEVVLTVLCFVLGISTFVMAILTFMEKTACSIGRGLLWLTASGLWFANGIYSLISQDILSISLTVEKDEDPSGGTAQ